MRVDQELSSSSLIKLTSFLFWSGLYFWAAAKAPDKGPEGWSRMVTLLHGSVATLVGLSQCGVTTVSESRLTSKIMPWHYALMVWSWGYFAFDLLWCMLYWWDSKLMLCHHASALIAITIYMNKDYTGCAFACTMAIMEVTNPLLQIRWFLKTEGYDKSMTYLMVEVLYLVMFLTLRGVIGTWLLYKIMRSDIFSTDGKVISLVFYFVSVAFIYDILGYVLYKYKHQIKRVYLYLPDIFTKGEFRGFLEELGIILNEQQ